MGAEFSTLCLCILFGLTIIEQLIYLRSLSFEGLTLTGFVLLEDVEFVPDKLIALLVFLILEVYNRQRKPYLCVKY